ncbi:hypothetical protein [Caballeronia sp. dw_19]|uniref:hypothetical protein n=1 Tax=Caballeronia sp. dw_19 TaxID=2719791 RepID=UPI001BD1D86D|nr:hypothetical protein [Caballeronia sp. dw_19]
MTREMLLPTAAAAARTVSLQNHLALVALRQGQGNIDLAGELLKTVYLTHLLRDPENAHATLENVIAAEQGLKGSILDAAITGKWILSEIDCQAIQTVLELYDAQLAAVPVHRIVAAKARLSRILEGGDFPNLAETFRADN